MGSRTSAVKNNLIKEYQGKYYHYDAQGNVIESQKAGEVLKLKWDNLNRLVESNRNGQITAYGYDVFGRRLYKKSQKQGQTNLTLFGWDGDLMIWESQKNADSDVGYTKHYIYEPNSFVPLLQAGYASFIQLKETPNYEIFKTVAYALRKDPLWRDDTRRNRKELERIAFYHCDQVGTPQTLSNERGECIWEITQNAWGETLEITANNNQLEQSNIRFQGQYYDEETGLHYNRYRYYEPYSARYVSKDPIGLNGGLNNSTYVDDPNQWVDSLGLESTFLSRLLPASAGQFETSSQNRRHNQGLANIRNGNLAMVNVAGYTPYALAKPADSVIAFVESSSTAQIALKGGISSAGLDGAVQTYQSIMCKCNAYNPKQSAGAFVGGAVGGVYAGKMLQTANRANIGSKATEIVQVGALNLHNNLTNVAGQTIWKQSAVVGAATGQMSKAIFTDGKTVKKPAKSGK